MVVTKEGREKSVVRPEREGDGFGRLFECEADEHSDVAGLY